MWNVAIKVALKGEAEMKNNIRNKRKTYKDIFYNSLQCVANGFKSHAFICHVTPSPYGLRHVKNEFSLVGLTACQCESGQSERESV